LVVVEWGIDMKVGRVLGALALCGALTAPAQAAACWNARTIEAAQIRQFDIMLMVSALRCQVKGVDFVADYNAFVRSNRSVLVGTNAEILRHFNAEMGGRAALTAYDRLGTAMANQFGNGGVSEDCETLRAIAREATATYAPPSREQLLGAAQQVGMEPTLPGAPCATVVAEARLR
jgi:hypothetical protein